VGSKVDGRARAKAAEPDAQALTAMALSAQAHPVRASLVALGIGAIVVVGIFVLTGHAAAVNAGPANSLFIACAFAGPCYAEMASTVRSPNMPWAR